MKNNLNPSSKNILKKREKYTNRKIYKIYKIYKYT